MLEDKRRRYSTMAKSVIFGTQMIASVLVAVCAVILTEYINQTFFFMGTDTKLIAWADQSLWLLAIFGIVWMFCLCYMTIVTGRRSEDQIVHLNTYDHLKTEIPVAVMLGTLICILFFALKIHRQDYQMMGRMILAGTFMLLADLCFMPNYLSLVRRVKTDTVMSNSWIGMLCHNVTSGMKPALFQTSSRQKRKLLEGMNRVTRGDFDFKLDLKEFQGADQQLADGINHMGEDLARMINERVVDERMKANMITNISHDLKTPLTSIINYIGLIRRENIENEKVLSYVEVLEQKAFRLKQLMDDLTEVSRLSSGNVSLQMMDIDLVELVRQTGGEFNEKMEPKGLTVVTKLPKNPVMIHADGGQLWRVIGNLYNNVSKYAMPNTRVHVVVEEAEGLASFSMKNITEAQLPKEIATLTERFVQGDESRSTEGSGLGLSISKMLTELMGGTFEISAEDDLFRVKITFKSEIS